jgi:hypothetical protein
MHTSSPRSAPYIVFAYEETEHKSLVSPKEHVETKEGTQTALTINSFPLFWNGN